jgi:hypothetical protein
MILKHNVLNFLKYDFRYALPYLTFDYIDETGIWYLSDTYFGFSLFPGSFDAVGKHKSGIVQKTYLKRGAKVVCMDSYIPGRGRANIHVDSFKNYLKQLFIPGSMAEIEQLSENMNTIIKNYVPIYRSGRDVKRDDIFSFYSLLGCNILEYDKTKYIRDHIEIKLDVKDDNNSPVFYLNDTPMFVYTAKVDPNLLFNKFNFVVNECFSKCDFIVSHTTAYVSSSKIRELCSFIFLGNLDEGVIKYFKENNVVLQKEGWKSVIVLLNSLPMSVVFKEFVLNDTSLIERYRDENTKFNDYDQRKRIRA